MKPEYVIGIEGGGTRTVGILADGRGKALIRKKTGPSNHHAVELPQTRKVLTVLVGDLIKSRRAHPSQVKAIGLCLAGAGRPSDRIALAPVVAALQRVAPVTLETDLVSALLAGAPAGYGVAAIAGTGSCFFGINPRGERRRLGGWGPILGDEGSGYAIGLAGLRAALRGFERPEARTRLTSAALTYYHLRDLAELVPLVRNADKALIAAFARTVLALRGRDPAAEQIAHDAEGEVADSLRLLARQLDLTPPFPVVLVGGLFHDRRFRLHVTRRLAHHLPHVTVVARPDGGTLGAVRLALRQLSF